MKYIFCLFSIVLFAKGCGETSTEAENAKSAQDDISIQYEASSRGFYQNIHLTKEQFSLTKIRNGKVSAQQDTTTEDWNEVVQLLDKIDSEKLKESSLNLGDIARDAAIPATLTVKYKDETVSVLILAHENPPKELAPLVTKLQAMAKAVEK